MIEEFLHLHGDGDHDLRAFYSSSNSFAKGVTFGSVDTKGRWHTYGIVGARDQTHLPTAGGVRQACRSWVLWSGERCSALGSAHELGCNARLIIWLAI